MALLGKKVVVETRQGSYAMAALPSRTGADIDLATLAKAAVDQKEATGEARRARGGWSSLLPAAKAGGTTRASSGDQRGEQAAE